jgi:hypothetical protein
VERKVQYSLKTARGLTARMKAIRIYEYRGVGTLKLEDVLRISIKYDQVLGRIHDAV